MRFTFLFALLLSHPCFASIDVTNVVNDIVDRSCQGLFHQGGDVLVVFGLGNFEFGGTRHNIGRDVVEAISKNVNAKEHSIPKSRVSVTLETEAEAIKLQSAFTPSSEAVRNGLTVTYSVGGSYSILEDIYLPFTKIVLVQPYYDINESGDIVAAIAKKAMLRPDQILVFVDDTNLKKGVIKTAVGKEDGLSDRHNGLKSLNQKLGYGNYHRVRIGVSNPREEKANVSHVDWVLGKMPEADRAPLLEAEQIQNFVSLIQNYQQRSGLDDKAAQRHIQQAQKIVEGMQPKP